MATRVLLVDDHRILRQGLRLLLEQQDDIEVVGETADGRSAIAMAKTLQPDVIVMDLAMPELNGIEATRQLGSALPRAHIVALSALSDRRSIEQFLKAGGAGFVVKDAAVDELVTAIRAVLAGRTYLSPRIADVVVDQFVRHGSNGAGAYDQLTPREREVLQLIAEGKATKEVAATLSVSVKTAETHRRSIMEKLRLDSVAELTKYAIREGLTTMDQ